MRNEITIAAESRDSRGKNEARRLRVAGKIPAVVYGAGKDAVPVSIDPKELRRILRSDTGHNTIFTVAIAGGESTPVMAVDWQNDPIRGNLLHADLKRIDLTLRLVVKVPIHITGEAKGVKQQGGLLEAITREVEVECLPEDIPTSFTMDVTELLIGQNVRASDIILSGSVKLKSSPDSVLAHVVALRAEATTAEAEDAAAVPEPEVIKKGKKDEEAGAEETKKKK
ncbi:MAG: 50S ribosomal protein L25 [Acidobacteria bacterium]|nr:50S ribosomal protein L25 [Acidobacteriota bacterium]